MKRFIVFGGLTYYAGGSWEDYVDNFDTAEGALKCMDNLHNTEFKYLENSEVFSRTLNWMHVVYTNTLKIIAEKGYSF